jgi:hypothetical protein
MGSETLIATSYQLDFVTPGILPSEASFRKQIRHMSNFRIYPLDLPQILQRRTKRVEYFGFFSALRIIALRAMYAFLTF